MIQKTPTYYLNPIGYVRASEPEQSFILEIDGDYRPALN